jgi:hypothetical protein
MATGRLCRDLSSEAVSVNVPFLESVRLVDQMTKLNKPIEFVMYPGEFHYFSPRACPAGRVDHGRAVFRPVLEEVACARARPPTHHPLFHLDKVCDVERLL